MKILYALQGTGNGHISRAMEVIPALKKRCEVDVLVSGTQADLTLPFKVDYQLNGFSFTFGKKGGVDFWNTYVAANAKALRDDIGSLPVENYDFVVNDFEPVSAWACLIRKVPCISLSHQAAVIDKNSPTPKKKNALGKFILKNYAPSQISFGFHFCRYSGTIYTPVIRKEVRHLTPTDRGHYTVYLPSFSNEELLRRLCYFPDVKWEVFSKHATEAVNSGNISIRPITGDAFLESMAASHGVLCGAGFETPAEALYLGKKLLVIPMVNQYEQQCNAASLKELGIHVVRKFNDKAIPIVREWLDSDYKIEIRYPDQTELIINHIFELFVTKDMKRLQWDKDYALTFPEKGGKIKAANYKFFSKKTSAK